MKKGKLLFLLIAVLSLALLLVACGNKAEPEDPVEPTDSVESSDQDGEKQQEVKHEMHDYFDFGEENAKVFTKVTQLKGEIVSRDDKNNLIALKTQDLNVKNEVIDTVVVYNYVTDEEIAKYEVSNLLKADKEDIKAELDVMIDYPIIQVTKTSYSEDSLEEVYDISYYFAKKDGELIRQTNKPNYEKYEFENGLVAIDMGDEMVWIDRNMEIVRTAASVAANGYNIDIYNAEYQGYLYTWTEESLQIFNLDGLCSGEYKIEHQGLLNVHVLDNGKVLIQDIEMVDAYTECDFKISNMPCVMTSYVMNYVDGTMEEVALDYIVDDLGTRYGERYGNGNDFPFALAAGRENQAMIYRIANGAVATDPEYVVLSNDLKIEYTVKNTTEGRDYYSATLLNDKLYAMNVYAGGTYQGYIFDLDGNAIAPVSRESWDDMSGEWTITERVTDQYIVTDNAIYDYNMNVVFDNSDGTFSDVEVDENLDRIYFQKHNFKTGAEEIYLFDEATKTPVLWNDGLEEVFAGAYYGGYMTIDLEEGIKNFYNAQDQLLLKTHFNIIPQNLNDAEDAMVVAAEFNGDAIVFIIK